MVLMLCKAFVAASKRRKRGVARMRIGFVRVASLAVGLVPPAVASAQTYVSQGPAPGMGPAALTISLDQPPNGTAAGAVEAVVADPTNVSTFYVGASNGGIWVTHDGGTSWTPLTDHQASLSITSLTLDPTDPTHKTLLAGTGLMSNGSLWSTGGPNFVLYSGGLRTGLLYTTDGGTSWTTLGGSTLAGLSIVDVEARGSVMLAAGFEPLATGRSNDPVAAQNGGLYRSTDGGKTFVPVAAGLPAGPVSSLVADPTNPSKFYAAVTSTSNFTATSVYASTDSGATWAPVFTSSTLINNHAGNLIANATGQVFVRVAAGPQNSLAMIVIDQTTNLISGIYLSLDAGQTWSRLVLPPNLGANAQAAINAAVAIDPSNPRIVYVTGDTIGSPAFTAAAYRVVLDNNGSSHFTSLTDARTADGSTIHADSRNMTFDANGRLILVNDGGIYARTSPQTNTGVWRGLNGNLSVWQTYAVAFDANSKRLVVAAQDTGAAVQSAPASVVFNNVVSGDGMIAAVNDRTLPGRSAIYTSQEDLFDFNRRIVDANGNPVGSPSTVLIQFDHTPADLGNTFQPPFALNRNDPTMFAFGTDHVYVSVDPLNGPTHSCSVDPSISNFCVTLHLTDLGHVGHAVGDATGQVFSVVYGTQDNAGALLAGVDNPAGKRLYLSTAPTPTSTTLLPLAAYNGQAPRSVVFDARTQMVFYAADLQSLWGSRDGGASFQDLTPNLPGTLIRPSAVEFIASNGVNALLTGGLSNAANAPSPIAVADSDRNGSLSNWRLFGNGLPNAPISALTYNAAADALAVGAYGRGAWLMYDVTSNFAQATVLQFGLANNDSNPDASLLTDGTVGMRPLFKYGTGTLTIAGAATYTGGTTILGGALQLGNGGAGGSILGNVVFCGDAGNPQCDASTGKALVFNRSDTYQFDGVISGPGQVQQNGSGRTILTAASSYTGPTFVDNGILSVNGSITSSPVFVAAGGALGGNGFVGPTTIMAGGTLSPGNSVGTITVVGNLAFASGGQYLVELQGGAADRTNVNGSATLAGIVGLAYLGGGLTNRYTILSATGGRSGTFDTIVSGLPGFLTASLAYTPTDVQLGLASGLTQTPGLARNQAAVAAALDATFNSGGGGLPDLFGVPASGIPGALSALSGEGVSGTQETAFGAAGSFLAAMLDQGAFWRSGSAIDVDGASFRAPLAYAGDAPTHPAFKAMRLKAPASFQPRWRAWMTAFDGSWSIAGDAATGSAGLTHRTAAAAGGVDYQLAPDLLVGTAAGGSNSSFAVSDRATSGTVDGAHLGAYGVKTWGNWYAAGALAFAAFDNNTSRTILGVGPTQIATGRFGSDLVSGRIELGLARAAGRFTVTPFAALQLAELWQNGFTETNFAPAGAAGPLGLSYGATTTTSVPTFLGAQADTRVLLWRNLVLAPYARLSWVHEFSPARAINAAFIALPGAAFTVDGPRAARDAARIDAGAKLAITASAYLFASFDGEFSSRSQAYAGKGGVRVAW